MNNTTGTTKAHGAKTLFWYLRIFTTMGICAGATATLWYQFINKMFPLAISPYGGVSRPYNELAVVWGISTLIVVAPIFFVFITLLRKAIARDEIELHTGMRQWVSFIFMFIVFTVIVSDLVTAMYFVLNGDYSTRFFLKVFTVLTIAGWLLAYTGLELYSKDALVNSALPRRMGAASVLAIIVSMGVGFTLIDSPLYARAKTFDAQRVSDIQQTQFGIRNYYDKHQKLPASLDELREEGMVGKYTIEDPATEKQYDYRIIDEQSYELCADFTTDNHDEEQRGYRRGPYGESLLHAAEHTCFEQNVQERHR
jgi:hypothetical protein